MAGVDFCNEISKFTEENFWNAISTNNKIVINNPDKEKANYFE